MRLQVASQPVLAERDVAAQVLEHYLDAVCSLLVDDVREGEPVGPRGGRQDLAREAEQIMDSFPDRPLTTTRLCQQLCVSRRSLFYAFQDVFGVSPMAYYKAKRLALVCDGIEGPGSGLDDRARGGPAVGVPPRRAVRPGLLPALWRTAFRYPSEGTRPRARQISPFRPGAGCRARLLSDLTHAKSRAEPQGHRPTVSFPLLLNCPVSRWRVDSTGLDAESSRS